MRTYCTYCMSVCVCECQQLHPNWDLEPVAFAPERFTFKPALSQMLRKSDNTFTPWTRNATRQTQASNHKRQEKCITVGRHTNTHTHQLLHPSKSASVHSQICLWKQTQILLSRLLSGDDSPHRFSTHTCTPTHTHTHISVTGIIIRVMNSHILPRQNLFAAVSRKPEHHVFSLLISSSFPTDVMKPLCVCVCVCTFSTNVCFSLRGCCRLSFVGSTIIIFDDCEWHAKRKACSKINGTVQYLTCSHGVVCVFLHVCG